VVICIGKGDQDGRVRPETLYRGNGQRLVGLIFKVNPYREIMQLAREIRGRVG